MKLILPLILLCVFAQAFAQTSEQAAANNAAGLPQDKAQPVRIARFDKAPVIDGRLEDEVWREAAIFRDFYQVQPGDNTRPSKPTEVRFGYDAKTLYIGFHAFDEPDKVRATIPKRDAVDVDDYVAVLFDTFNDERKAYALYFNPLGVQGDAVFTEGSGFDFSVDILMESKGVITNDGYTVEVAVPFKSLRYEAGKGKAWGLHLRRVIKRFNNELDSWMPISRDRSALLSQAGRITGLENISTERTLELIPSLTVSETGRRVAILEVPASDNLPLPDSGRILNQPMKLDPGMTMKLGITPTITLDLAVNPDFAQVESDQIVVTANQRFPIFFEEKRPFFLEGIDIFRTPLQAVHTRAIIDPDVAIKLTGKKGRNTFGVLLASDNAPGSFTEEEQSDPETFQRIEKFIDRNAYIGILRLKRDVGREGSLGFLATSYNFIEKRNQLGGFDGRFRLDPKTVFTLQLLGTTSRRFFYDADEDRDIYRTGNGFRYYYDYERVGRNFTFELYGTGQTRDYRADVGFTQRINVNTENLYTAYNSTPRPQARLVSWSVQNFNYLRFDWQGHMLGWAEDFNVGFSFPRQTRFNAAYIREYERVFEGEFGANRTRTRRGAFAGDDAERSVHKHAFDIYGGTTPDKKFSGFWEFYYVWGELDFDFGAGERFPRVSPAGLMDADAPLDPGPGNLLSLTSRLDFQPTAALRVSLNYNKSKLTRRDTHRTAYDENIYALRATYQFTRFTFARARLDYTSINARVRGQFLLGWTPNPGTSFYAGYNDDLSINGFSPFTERLEPGFRRNGRTFFIKMSYLFRKSF